MAQQGYLFIKGAVQGEIETDLDKANVEGGIPFYKFHHAIRVPGLEAGGRREGLPVHGVIELVKEVDQTSTKLLRALCVAEMIEEVEIKWYSIENGVETLFYSIEMTGCRIVGITTEKPDVRQPANEHLRISETLELSYRTIRWEYGLADAELVFEFDVNAPLDL